MRTHNLSWKFWRRKKYSGNRGIPEFFPAKKRVENQSIFSAKDSRKKCSIEKGTVQIDGQVRVDDQGESVLKRQTTILDKKVIRLGPKRGSRQTLEIVRVCGFGRPFGTTKRPAKIERHPRPVLRRGTSPCTLEGYTNPSHSRGRGKVQPCGLLGARLFPSSGMFPPPPPQ